MPKPENKQSRRRLFGAWLSSLISIAMVLLLIGITSLLLVNASELTSRFRDQIKLTVLLSDELSDDEAAAFVPRLGAREGIKELHFISRAQGRQEMSDMLGGAFLDVFEEAVIPASCEVTLLSDYVSGEALERVLTDLRSLDEVDSVHYDAGFVDAALRNVSRLTLVLGVVILLLLFISFVLIGNTVRIHIFSRRFTIHTMKMVGATKAFIRRPFLWRALVQGAVAAVLAFVLLLGFVWWLRQEVPALDFALGLRQLLLTGGIMLASGVLICWVSTWISVGRLISLSKDELYF